MDYSEETDWGSLVRWIRYVDRSPSHPSYCLSTCEILFSSVSCCAGKLLSSPYANSVHAISFVHSSRLAAAWKEFNNLHIRCDSLLCFLRLLKEEKVTHDCVLLEFTTLSCRRRWRRLWKIFFSFWLRKIDRIEISSLYKFLSQSDKNI